jgi:vitamin B12 transporter
LDPNQENVMHLRTSSWPGSGAKRRANRPSITVLSVSAALIAGLSPALADDSVETVVVTATRTEQPPAKTGTSITIITADDLKTQQIDVLSDILRETPAAMVVRSGGVGQTTTLSLRGAEQGQTVALIDGVRINDPSDVSEGALFGDVLVNNIDRVEILRGPQSTLYGSDAIGGVVNIITKRGGDTPFALNASVEGGSFATYHANAAANGSMGAVDYGAALNYFSTGGISAADSRNGNPEADGYRNLGATLNTRIHAGDTLSFDLRGYYTHGHAAFDDNFSFTPPFLVADSAANDTDELFAGYGGVNLDLFGGVFRNRVAIIASSGSRQYFDSAFDTIHLNFDYFGNATRFEYQGIVDIDPDNQVTFGAETQDSSFRNDNFSSFSPEQTNDGRDRITGYYAQVQSTIFERLTLTGGLRLDDDQEFGTHTSIKLAAAWQLPAWDTTLRANYGDGFKAPTLYQLFSPYSNPISALKPETAKGWEVGADKSFWDDRLRASFTYFERRTANQIDFQDCFSPADAPGCPFRLAQFGYYVNLDRTRAAGIETEIAAHITDTLNISANYTNMSATNTVSGLDLSRRPRDTASATVTWRPLPDVTLGASATYIGARFNDLGNTTPLSASATVNLFGSYDLGGKWQAFGRVDNVFDNRIEQVTGYGVPGIGAFAGLRTSL